MTGPVKFQVILENILLSLFSERQKTINVCIRLVLNVCKIQIGYFNTLYVATCLSVKEIYL